MDNNEWEYKHIIQIADPITETVGGRELETLSISAGKGFVNQAEKFGKELSGKQYEKYIVLRKGDFSYNKGNSKRYPQGCIYRLNNREKAAVPNVFESFRLKSGVGDFFEQLFISGYLNKQLFEKINSGVRNDGLLNLNGKDFYSCYVPFPPIEEQKKISEILMLYDEIINLCEKKLEQLRLFKKSCLQKMFPKKGSNVPEIRFPGFTDPWEQRKLGDLMEVTSVKRIHQSDWTEEGIRFIRARDIVAKSKNEEITEPLFISEEKYNEYSAISGKVKIGDLLVTGVGTIGVPMLIDSEEPLYFKDGNVIWFKNEDTIEGRFFYNSFIGANIQNYIRETSGSGTVGTYTIDSGKKTPILLPKERDEQSKIGHFFSDLDNLITLHQRKCDLEREKKKALMQLLLTGIIKT